MTRMGNARGLREGTPTNETKNKLTAHVHEASDWRGELYLNLVLLDPDIIVAVVHVDAVRVREERR